MSNQESKEIEAKQKLHKLLVVFFILYFIVPLALSLTGLLVVPNPGSLLTIIFVTVGVLMAEKYFTFSVRREFNLLDSGFDLCILALTGLIAVTTAHFDINNTEPLSKITVVLFKNITSTVLTYQQITIGFGVIAFLTLVVGEEYIRTTSGSDEKASASQRLLCIIIGVASYSFFMLALLSKGQM